MLEMSEEDWADEEIQSSWWLGKKVERRKIERRLGRLLGRASITDDQTWRVADERDIHRRRYRRAESLSLAFDSRQSHRSPNRPDKRGWQGPLRALMLR